MKCGKRVNICAVILGLAGVFQILIPLVIFPVCQKQIETAAGGTVPMKCHWYAMAVVILGGALILQALLKLWVKQPETSAYGGAVTLLTGVATMLLHNNSIIGLCANARMACRMATLPAVNILAGITIVVSLTEIVLNLRDIKHKNQN